MSRLQQRLGLVSTTWWYLGLSLALCASLGKQDWQFGAISVLAVLLVSQFGPKGKRWQSLRLYLWLCLSILIIRLVFRIVFSGGGAYVSGASGLESPVPVLVNLPHITFTIFASQVSLLGPITSVSIGSALTDSLRLSAIVLGVAMANIIANPRKLLRSTPTAFYEVASAAAVAINLAPQLIASISRVSRARELRGGSAKGLARLGGIVIPVLEDTVQKSLDLAASMDSRGFGRQGRMAPWAVVATKTSSVLAVLLLGFASYFLLTNDGSIWLAIALAGIGLLLFAVTIRLAGLYRVRSRLTLEHRSWLDYLVTALATIAVLALALGQVSP